ncbi:hypothetical protein [Komagataeibacter oboediens]|uniref:hypothetical protein n=1 Tax=Komagataeibacter oboediens TaxID=65958 RepID=UPI0019B3BF51|nr:hypothetical protein [Komagataeibacter oboediens]GCE79076.1 hypothetical protein MSKU3_0551 [Komagataeibacter oboediens]
MELIIGTGTVVEASRDTMPATGTPGWATDGDPASSIPATDFPASHYNMTVAEMVQVILDAGLTLDRTNWGQLSAAIQKMIANPYGGTIFTPVQQGGGPNQTTDKVNLGQDSTYEGLLRLSIDGVDHGTLLSGTYLATITGTTGDLPGMGLWFQAASQRPAFTYQDATSLPKIIDLAMNTDVQTLQSNQSSFQTAQTNTNTTLSADISQCVSGVYGVATSAGDRQGKGLYQAGGSGRPTFVYNNGTTDVYNALAYYDDVTALSATLSTDISNCVSGIAASGDAQGLKLYQSTGSGRPHFFYTGGDEYLATYTDVTTVQANQTSFQTSQANQNSTFATEIASKVGTNTTNDGVNSPITYLGHNNASGAPFVISSLAGSYRIIPSRPGAGYNSISNMSTDGAGNIDLADSSGAFHSYAPASTGTIAASGNISGGWWVKTGNILRQCLKISSTAVSGTIQVTFPTAYTDVPTISAEWADLDGNSAWCNVLVQNGAPVISATGVSLWARALGDGGALADSAGWGWVTVEGPVSS